MTSDHGEGITNGGIPPDNQLWVYEHEGIKYPGFFAGNPAEHLPNIQNMRCELDDTIICSYPKSGQYIYRIRNIVGESNFSERFRKLINRYKRIGYNPYVMQQTACLVINPVSVDSYASICNCTTAGRALDAMTALT